MNETKCETKCGTKSQSPQSLKSRQPRLVDAHCHLEHKRFAADIDAVIARARDAGFEHAINAGSSPQANEQILRLLEKHAPFLKTVLGLSPHDAHAEGDAGLQRSLAFLEKNKEKIMGVGEIGLEFHYFKREEERESQRRAFRAQLDWARDNALPVVVHSREASAETLSFLRPHNGAKVWHCFGESELASDALAAGCFLSLPTLKSSSAVIHSAPLERLLCETDSPFLSLRGKSADGKSADGKSARNEPAEARWVYEEIARVKQKPFDEVAARVRENVRVVFGF
ncbi:MAG: TatD family hydrolase [Candidatus Micrarchaeota archaeon]